MPGPRRFLLLGAVAGFLFFSCAGPEPGFVFRDAEGRAVGLKTEVRGSLLPGGGLPPEREVVFSFRKPLAVEEDGMALHLLGRGPAGGRILSAHGVGRRGSGDPVVSAPLPGLPGAGKPDGTLEFFLLLPRGVYGGFALRRAPAGEKTPSGDGGGGPFQVLEAGIRGHRREAGVSPRGILAASDLNLEIRRDSCVFRTAPAGAGGGNALAVTLWPPAGAGPELLLSGGGGSFRARITPRPVPETFYFHPPFLGFPPETIEVRGLPAEAGLLLRSLPRRDWEKGAPSFDPIPTDLRLLAEGLPVWRRPDFEVFSWNLFPEILLFDTRDYGVQNRLFHRLAFFTEKKGFRGSLQPDGVIQDRHGWNAHNYSAEGLAAFFEAARRASFPLNEMEVWLGEYLLSRGVLKKNADAFAPGRGGVLGVSRESSPAHRRLLLTHEIFHGIYYELPGYRRLVENTWDRLPPEQKEFWKLFLSWMQYDVTDPGLLVNEFQAYLLQQPPGAADEYFRKTVTSRILARYPERGEWFEELFRRHPRMFAAPAGILSAHLEAALGVRGGEVFSLHP